MTVTNIQCINSIYQDAREGVYTMNGLALTRLLHNAINEYGHYYNGSFAVNLNDLSYIDKKILLSHIADSADFSHSLENPTAFEVVFDEYREHMNKLLSAECDHVYREAMYEQQYNPENI